MNGGNNGQIGLPKSYKVFAGDKLSIQAYASYLAPTGTGSNLSGFASALLSAFNLAPPAGGEVGTASAALNYWGGVEAGGFSDGSSDNSHPKVFVNIIIFDKDYKFLDVAYQQLTSNGALMSSSYTVKEAGYAFMYLSNEQQYQTDVYFGDVSMSYTPGNIIQSNEYYPFGLQTSNSWTRDNAVANNFLANGGTELNTTYSLYDLDYRNYDPVLGRMNGVDPMASKYSSISPYNFVFNDPVFHSDPSGADPRMSTDMYERDKMYPRYRLQDLGTYIPGMPSSSGYGAIREPGEGLIDWSGDPNRYLDAGAREDADAVNNGTMSQEEYAAKHSSMTIVNLGYYSYGSSAWAETENAGWTNDFYFVPRTQGDMFIPAEKTWYFLTHGKGFDIVHERQVSHKDWGYTLTTRSVIINYEDSNANGISDQDDSWILRSLELKPRAFTYTGLQISMLHHLL